MKKIPYIEKEKSERIHDDNLKKRKLLSFQNTVREDEEMNFEVEDEDDDKDRRRKWG